MSQIGDLIIRKAQPSKLILKAEADNADAQYNLGCWYENGQDYIAALFWYIKAVKQGHANAKIKLIRMAEQGSAYAQNSLGNCYYYGHGVEQNNKEAFKWFKKAAEQNNGIAQRNLGNCYVLGAGVPKDFEKAKMWHDKAKENGEEYNKELIQKMAEAFNP